jgi:hypothetical protein
VLPLLQAERRRFVETLHWDLGPALKMVETARPAWGMCRA